MTRILIVEDDGAFAQEFAEYLERHGLKVYVLASLDKVLDVLRDFVPALAVFDQFVAGEDVLAWLPRLRSGFEGGIVVLTGNPEQADRVIGLELGADDFVAKSLTPREILARLRAILRRRPAGGAAGSREWTLDPEQYCLVAAGGERIVLSPAEFDLLALLSARAGEIVSRETLSQAVLRREFSPTDRSIDNLVSALRMALQPLEAGRNAIQAVRGVGYVFVGFD